MTEGSTRGKSRAMIAAILSDTHFWVPVVVLVMGLVMLVAIG